MSKEGLDDLRKAELIQLVLAQAEQLAMLQV